jgi:hypothetical protein
MSTAASTTGSQYHAAFREPAAEPPPEPPPAAPMFQQAFSRHAPHRQNYMDVNDQGSCDWLLQSPMSNAPTAPGLHQQPLWHETRLTANANIFVPPPGLPVRLSTKAKAFRPQKVQEDPAKGKWLHYFAELVKTAQLEMLASGHVANVEIHLDETSGWSMILQPSEDAHIEDPQATLLRVAKDALLSAAKGCKRVFIMGFTMPESFVMHSQGFEVTLGAMADAKYACWHVYKKGFCQHGTDSDKQHPPIDVPIRVFFDIVQCYNCADCVVLDEFTEEVGKLAIAVADGLRLCAYADDVEAFRNEKGWTIQMVAKEECKAHKEYLLTFAKHTLLAAASNSCNAAIMGYAAKPFVSRSDGFITMFGNLRDERRACWYAYSGGHCIRNAIHGQCGWEHPEYCLPVNIVVKERWEDSLNAILL